uniref:KRAB domain-containing protein n=1 Tax=Urocitellus parryii TaxID=9999 RepID=A0A8D2HXY6_UROPR
MQENYRNLDFLGLAICKLSLTTFLEQMKASWNLKRQETMAHKPMYNYAVNITSTILVSYILYFTWY